MLDHPPGVIIHHAPPGRGRPLTPTGTARPVLLPNESQGESKSGGNGRPNALIVRWPVIPTTRGCRNRTHYMATILASLGIIDSLHGVATVN